MRIEKLNKDKIKVTLTTAELINLDIDVKRLSPDSKELHTFLFHIMETIREETGFNPYNGQVVVEATPSQDGISILVKRLNKGIKKITEEQFKKVVSVKPKKKEPGTECVFYFETFNDMCGAISEMDKSILSKASLFMLVIKCKDNMDKCLYLSWRLSFAGRSEKNAACSGHAQI